jgi:hypothetical protein
MQFNAPVNVRDHRFALRFELKNGVVDAESLGEPHSDLHCQLIDAAQELIGHDDMSRQGNAFLGEVPYMHVMDFPDSFDGFYLVEYCIGIDPG